MTSGTDAWRKTAQSEATAVCAFNNFHVANVHRPIATSSVGTAFAYAEDLIHVCSSFSFIVR